MKGGEGNCRLIAICFAGRNLDLFIGQRSICCHLLLLLQIGIKQKNSRTEPMMEKLLFFPPLCIIDAMIQFFIRLAANVWICFFFIFLFDMLLFMRRAKRNIPLTGRLLSLDINHRHGNETVLTKGETDGGIQMQTFRSPPTPPPPFSVSRPGTSTLGDNF